MDLYFYKYIKDFIKSKTNIFVRYKVIYNTNNLRLRFFNKLLYFAFKYITF